MKNTIIAIAGLLVLALVGFAVAASAVSLQDAIRVDLVEVDNVAVDSSSARSFVRGNDVPIHVEFTALKALSNVELKAAIRGFEHNDNPNDRIESQTVIFDIDGNGTRYSKDLKLKIPDDLSEDTVQLRLEFSSKSGDVMIKSYTIKIDVPRHLVRVKELIVSPSKVNGGESLLAKVRVQNKGSEEEKNLRITVSLPELNLAVPTFISSLNTEEEKNSEEVVLPLDVCADAKTYLVKATVEYNDGRNVAGNADKKTVEVVKSDLCGTNASRSTSVVAESGNWKVGLENAVLVLVALLVLVVLVFAFKKMHNSDE